MGLRNSLQFLFRQVNLTNSGTMIYRENSLILYLLLMLDFSLYALIREDKVEGMLVC